MWLLGRASGGLSFQESVSPAMVKVDVTWLWWSHIPCKCQKFFLTSSAKGKDKCTKELIWFFSEIVKKNNNNKTVLIVFCVLFCNRRKGNHCMCGWWIQSLAHGSRVQHLVLREARSWLCSPLASLTWVDVGWTRLPVSVSDLINLKSSSLPNHTPSHSSSHHFYEDFLDYAMDIV